MSTYPHKEKFRIWPLVISLLITLSIGAVAGFFTQPQIAGWYVNLVKPSFNPPNWVFAPAWTTLYIMIAIAAYLVWQRRNGSYAYANARNVYLLQLLFNFSWSIFFLGCTRFSRLW